MIECLLGSETRIGIIRDHLGEEVQPLGAEVGYLLGEGVCEVGRTRPPWERRLEIR
jgi:hypothetical protein